MRMRFLIVVVIGVAIMGSAFLGFWLGKHLTTIRQWQDMARSECHFRQIRLSLLNYHNEYGRFPPTKYQAEPEGAIHSWRVMLSPYAGPHVKERYSKYDFSEPWNSPGNLAVAQLLSPELPFSMNDDGLTNYLAIGEEDKWPTWPFVGHLNAFLVTAGEDGFLLVEYPRSQIYWTRPKY